MAGAGKDFRRLTKLSNLDESDKQPATPTGAVTALQPLIEGSSRGGSREKVHGSASKRAQEGPVEVSRRGQNPPKKQGPAGSRSKKHKLSLGDLSSQMVAAAETYKVATDLIASWSEEGEEQSVVLREERDDALSKLERAKKAFQAKCALLDQVKKEKDEALLAQVKSANEVKALTSRVTKLEEDLMAAQRQITRLESEKQEAINLSVKFGRWQFDNALEQVGVLHPRLTLDRQYLSYNYEVRGNMAGGQIVKPVDEDEEGNVIPEEVIWEAHE